MKTKAILLLLLVCSTLVVAQKQFNDTIPFRNDLGLIIIPIQFNGVEKNFVFDTGASVSVGFSWVKSELVKTSKTLKITSSSRKKSRLRYYKSDSVNLASAKITKHRILATNDSNIFSCYNIDGVLGVDIIAQFNWVINYDQKYLIMRAKDFFPDSLKNMHKIDFDYDNRRPYAFLNFGNERLRFLLDTGATFSDIYIKDYSRIQNINHTKRVVYTGFFDFRGTLNKSKSTIMRFPSVTAEDIDVDGIFEFSKKSSKIGNTLWKDNTLFLSLEGDMLYTDHKEIKESRKDYGCAFVYDNNRITVVKVIVDSEAWEQGLRQGDDVQMINGKTFDDFCSLQKFQKEVSAKAIDLTITLKDGVKIILKKKKVL
ncbi:aspartyl protease family protein [uncultured Aquimarina sp.]|uniref:aspartyl protease family protein n=1 Tax=uncultured Aquimarina sp. TaxID=575652 RepID=UPI002617787C|nr:aspartyl protease family protein [uncultured Aquimarina sp.]